MSQLAGQIAYNNSLLETIHLHEQEVFRLNNLVKASETREMVTKAALDETRDTLSDTRRKLGVAQMLTEKLSSKAKSYRVQLDALQAVMASSGETAVVASSSQVNMSSGSYDTHNYTSRDSEYEKNSAARAEAEAAATELRQLRKISIKFTQAEVNSVADHSTIASLHSKLSILENTLSTEKENLKDLLQQHQAKEATHNSVANHLNELKQELQKSHYRASMESEARTNLERQLREAQRQADKIQQALWTSQASQEQSELRVQKQNALVIQLEKEAQRSLTDISTERNTSKKLEKVLEKVQEENLASVKRYSTLRDEMQHTALQLQEISQEKEKMTLLKSR